MNECDERQKDIENTECCLSISFSIWTTDEDSNPILQAREVRLLGFASKEESETQ